MAKEPRALVKNSSDEEQTRTGRAIERSVRDQQLLDLATVLDTPEGKRVFWRLLAHCSTYGSVFHRDSTILAYNAGKQDVGHFLMAELTTASPDAYAQMQRDAAKDSPV